MDIVRDGWSAGYDDGEIDEIVWSEIQSSPSRGDFVCYFIHDLSKARHEREARVRLESMPEQASIVPVHYARAAERIRELAESGNAAAMFHMGKLSVHGIGVEQNLRVAEWWYGKAIDRGEMRAFCNMGWLYLSGFEDSLGANKAKAFELLSAGAASGIAAAETSVGLMLVTGEGCEADPERGLQRMQKAFDAGYGNAGNHLSDLYFSGRFVPRDIDLAHEWLLKVAERGDERTMAILGHYLVTGSHGKQDVDKGVSLLEESIAKGHVPAYLWLGCLYRDGRGVGRDPEKARAWFERGAADGNSGCTMALTSMLLRARPASGESPAPTA